MITSESKARKGSAKITSPNSAKEPWDVCIWFSIILLHCLESGGFLEEDRFLTLYLQHHQACANVLLNGTIQSSLEWKYIKRNIPS